ncbi:MAG: prepilin-type N-terminal cleavage/methylation domain-containing protein [Planctomycetaceae bacterium]|nr:prepilin-type N-terminal cleavage/methylation domain-containing protein [Planctomycetaceae bacterium]
MKKPAAFTLIELLVVIAIIALLLSIIIPSLKNAKRYAAAAVCLANEAQLGKAYMLYAEDNDSQLADGDTSDQIGAMAGFETYGTVKVHCWVGQPMNAARAVSNISLADKIRGFEIGSLWPYIMAPKAYHCPADNRSNTIDSTVGMLGYRTYSIGKPLSRRPSSNPGENDVEIHKFSEFVNPSGKIIFLEEAEKERGWNHRTWNMNLVSPTWTDPFAIFHNDSSTFVFADGHADRHKWLEQQTRDMAEAGVKGWSAKDPKTGTTYDWDWFKKVYIPGRKPSTIP